MTDMLQKSKQNISNFIQNLQKFVGQNLFKAWFSKCEFTFDDDILVVHCPNTFVRDWIKRNYMSVLEDASKAKEINIEVVPKIVSTIIEKDENSTVLEKKIVPENKYWTPLHHVFFSMYALFQKYKNNDINRNIVNFYNQATEVMAEYTILQPHKTSIISSVALPKDLMGALLIKYPILPVLLKVMALCHKRGTNHFETLSYKDFGLRNASEAYSMLKTLDYLRFACIDFVDEELTAKSKDGGTVTGYYYPITYDKAHRDKSGNIRRFDNFYILPNIDKSKLSFTKIPVNYVDLPIKNHVSHTAIFLKNASTLRKTNILCWELKTFLQEMNFSIKDNPKHFTTYTKRATQALDVLCEKGIVEKYEISHSRPKKIQITLGE